MFNHNRGLWGYTGTAPDGGPLTIQSTGMGGPSAAIVISELADLGAGRLLRVGTCGALEPSLSLGDLVIASESIARDGTSRALGAEDRTVASADLLSALARAADGHTRTGTVLSTDLFYETEDGTEQGWADAGALAVEMETATLFALAARRGLSAGALLLVTDLLLPARVRIPDEELKAGEERMGQHALHALA